MEEYVLEDEWIDTGKSRDVYWRWIGTGGGMDWYWRRNGLVLAEEYELVDEWICTGKWRDLYWRLNCYWRRNGLALVNGRICTGGGLIVTGREMDWYWRCVQLTGQNVRTATSTAWAKWAFGNSVYWNISFTTPCTETNSLGPQNLPANREKL